MNKDKYTWDLTQLYKSDDDPQIEKDFKESISKVYEFINKWKDRSDYLKDPAVLKSALDEYNALEEKYGIGTKPDYYLSLRNSQDEADKNIIKRQKQFEKEEIKAVNDIQFFEMKIAKIPKEKQNDFLKFNGLKQYKHLLERLFESSKYILSEKEEKIINLTSSTSHSNWIDMTEQFLSKETISAIDNNGKRKTVPFSENSKYLRSKKKNIRKFAAKEEIRVLKKFSDIAEHEMNSILERKRVIDELKGFKRPDESRHLSDDISSKTVDSLIEAVSEDFSLSEKYYKLKAELMGKKSITYFERYIPYGEITKKYTYEEAISIVEKIFYKLDSEFGDFAKEMEENGNIDIFPRKGKRGGGYCIHTSRILPIYILLNFDDTFNSVSTIAHELGHGINDYMMFKSQSELNADSPLSTAEVSSTFFEDFVINELIKDAEKETKLILLMQKLDSDIGAIHRQVACYRFEQELHNEFRKESYLSKERISEIFKKHMESYMGKYVTQDKGSEYFWIEWPHIRTFFYVYSYANGLLISKALQNMVKEGPKNIEKVKVMLSAGTSKSPEEMFKSIGIDITKKEFWEKGLKEIENTYEETYKLAKKLGKI